MRFVRTNFAVFFSLLFAIPVFPQQTATSNPQSSPQAIALLQQSLAALTGGQSITDVTLSGTARRIAGSDDESGSAILKASASLGNRIDLSLPSGPRSEVRNVSTSEQIGSWSGTDGVAHPISQHNLVTDAGWFSAFALVTFVSPPNVVTYVGPETRNGSSVIHLGAFQQFPGIKATVAAQLQRLSQTQIFLDSSTLLPVAITFTTHPDNNSSLDIPVEIDFSDYRNINGAQVPFHIQRYLNGSLSLDLQFQNVAINSGIPPSTFAVTVQAGL
ncbi:MAG TPA: hypothetical protein VE263_13350 [Candidatus Angelobacter sp.]|nr:hypothetical protein [Candidatus Angelobacter sp.]